MKLDIKKMLQERAEYLFTGNEDILSQIVQEDNSDVIYFISCQRYIKKVSQTKNYYVSALFDLADFINCTAIRFYLIKLTKVKPLSVKTSVYHKRISQVKKSTKWEMIDNFPVDYNNYINAIEKWENDGSNPADTADYSFNLVNFEDFDAETLNPCYYTKSLQEVKKNLSKEKLIELDKIANILSPRIIKDEKGKVLTARYFKYPINYADISIKNKSDIELKKGDIVVTSIGDFTSYLIREKPKEKIYANRTDYVIRLFNSNYAPEYIQMYLSSDIYKNLIELKYSGGIVQKCTKRELARTKIIVPKRDRDYYKELFNYQLSPSEYKKNCHNILFNGSELKDFETIFSIEQIHKASCNYNEQIQEIFNNDLDEVQACFKAKAYKATLIMCGAILEAFLLDWLDELEPKENWPQKETIYDKCKGKDVPVGLDVYIKAIKRIKKPMWMKDADKAFEIKNQRNLVHTKLCLKDDINIDKGLCEKVIKYLAEVIRTR